MQYSRYSSIYTAMILSLACMHTSYAANEENQLAPIDNSPQQYEKIIRETQPDNIEKLTTELPSSPSQQSISKEDSIEYLLENPDKFEGLLSILLKQGNAESLEELLPYYKQVPNYDPSVIDWGNAIIKARNGKLDEAIVLYRDINAKLPDVEMLRFQMAMALFYNRQFEAAKSEFESLRSNIENQEDIAVINRYLDAISQEDKWDINANVSFLNDKNITNAPPVGTKIDKTGVSYDRPHEAGKGISYGLYADKKWLADNRLFTALHLNTNGSYYVDNKKFNDVTAGVGVGVGYQNAITELELQPFVNRRWYGGGTNTDGDDSLKQYADSRGLRLSLSQWLGRNWQYQGLARINKSNYQKPYDYNNGTDKLLVNTMVYIPNSKQYWTAGIDYATKDAKTQEDSYDRKGIRVGWGQTWPKGFASRVNIGYAKRNYHGQGFDGFQRENKEYNTGVTLWNRGVSIFTLTPRLSWNYNKVTSNSPLAEYDKHDVSIELTKTF